MEYFSLTAKLRIGNKAPALIDASPALHRRHHGDLAFFPQRVFAADVALIHRDEERGIPGSQWRPFFVEHFEEVADFGALLWYDDLMRAFAGDVL
jgi:hypothetical protein